MWQFEWIRRCIIVMVLCCGGIVVPLALRGQPPVASKGSTPGMRITFDVVQSYDAKYAGDTPGHLGRAGGLDRVRLNVALGDPIYREEAMVGKVTGLTWNRTNGSLDIEFDPVAEIRVAVGDEVWMAIDGRKASSGAPRDAK